MKRVLAAAITILFALQTVVVPGAWAGQKVWEGELADKVSWSDVTLFGTLLVGSKTSLSSYNPETGELLWIREDLKKIAPFDVREATGFPILIIGKDEGFGGAKAQVEAISMADGKTIWATDKVKGFPLGVYMASDRPLVILLVNDIYDQNQTGIYASAYDVQTGESKWRTLFTDKPNKIPTYPADNMSAFYARADFSGYHDPVFEGDKMYTSFDGLRCFDLNTGEQKWHAPFKTAHKTYKKAYAAPVIEGDMIYASGESIIYAINKQTGEIKWQTEKVRSGLVGQVVVAEDMVMARIGGNFYNPGAKQYTPDKPFGVYAFNKETGVELWEFKGAKNGITNMVYLPEINAVFLADAKSLIGIDTKSSGKVKEAFRLKLEFKRAIGTTDVASAGVKALTGGIGGLLNAGAKMAIGKDREDPPVSVQKLHNGMVIVRGQQHILSFDPKKQEINWSLAYSAPGASGLGIAMVAAVSAFSVIGYQGFYASGNMSASRASENVKGQFARMDKYLDKRFSKTQSDEKQTYILTTVDTEGESGVGVMAINLETGEEAGQFLFDEKEPEYAIDSLGGRLYFFPKKKGIVAYDLN